MSNINNIQALVKQCTVLHSQRTILYLYYSNGNYFVTNEEPLERSSVVKERYQFVPPCCVNRWYYKAINDAVYRLNNLRANDNAD